MKSLKLQIEFIDKKLIVLYGFKGITDYSYSISTSESDIIPIDLVKLNELIVEFRKIFHAKNFSLHKTQYKILTKSQAICLLKTCLEITSIPFDMSLKQKKKYLRLISKNNILDDYINSLKMSENRTSHSNLPTNSPEYENKLNSKEKSSERINLMPLYPTPFADICYFLNLEENNDNKNNDNNGYTSNMKYKLESTYDTSGLKEYKEPKTITKEELINSIKKTTKFEYVTFSKKILNGSNIQINMKNYELSDKILKSFCVKFISKELNSVPIISEHFITEITKNILFEVVIGGNHVCNWSGKFSNNINCIVDNIILPLNCLDYHQVYLNLKNIEPLINLLENFEFVISGEYLSLYSEIDNILQSNLIEQIICIEDKYNLLRIMSGMANNAFTEYLDLSEFNDFKKEHFFDENNNKTKIDDKQIFKIKKDIVNESKIFIGKPMIVNSFEGYEIVEFKSGFNIKHINKALTYGYDFICWKNCDSFENINNYFRKLICKNKFSHNYKITLGNFNWLSSVDSIDFIEIMFENVNFDNINELNLFYYKNDKKLDYKVKFTILNKIINIDLNFKHLNTISNLSDIGLEFITNSSDEPVKDKILLLTRKFIWAEKFIIKMRRDLKNKIEFVPNK